jgi:chaperonin GroES
MSIKPLSDRILVKAFEEDEVMRGGIIIPDTAKEKPQKGEVVETGPGRLNDSTGDRLPLEVSKGDQVLYGKYSGSEVTIEDEKYIILRESDILAVL